MAYQRPRRRPGGRRDEILELFTAFVAERGYDGTNFGDLAQELGVSKGTIVHHFGTKERMLEEQRAHYLRRRLAEASVVLRSLDSPSEQLAAFIHLFVFSYRDDRASTVAFAREVVRFSEESVMRRVSQLRDEYTSIVRSVVQRGMDSGEFRPGDAALVTLQIFGACNWAWTWFKPRGRCTAEQVAASFTDVFLTGLVARPPIGAELTAPGGPVLRAVLKATEAARSVGVPEPAAPVIEIAPADGAPAGSPPASA